MVLASQMPNEIADFKPISKFAQWEDPFFHYNYDARTLTGYTHTSDRLILLIMNKLNCPDPQLVVDFTLLDEIIGSALLELDYYVETFYYECDWPLIHE